ncbi:MAG TPA: Eco29kI family restriction endonuclease [Candidatus Angelobacter sp.]|nr:Eco29kI family restriction endonuclease [Candidatus Angelobacter sp.]
MRSEPPYNPLDKKNLGTSVADALLARTMGPLPPEDRFLGAGVYAIYYSGDFPLYSGLSSTMHDVKKAVPIYVGKAVPLGARKGGLGLDAEAGSVLFNRLTEHAGSIQEASNLSLEHFSCRYLVVDDIWIPLGESLLIQSFAPLWNRVLDGFGNHDPGKGRYQQQRSPWDVIHPGRSWAERLQPCFRTDQQLSESVREFLRQQLPTVDPKS